MSTMERLKERVDAGAPVAEVVEETLRETGYLDALAAERTIEAQGRIENLEEFVRVAREYDVAGNMVGIAADRALRVDDDDLPVGEGPLALAEAALGVGGVAVHRDLPGAAQRLAEHGHAPQAVLGQEPGHPAGPVHDQAGEHRVEVRQVVGDDQRAARAPGCSRGPRTATGRRASPSGRRRPRRTRSRNHASLATHARLPLGSPI